MKTKTRYDVYETRLIGSYDTEADADDYLLYMKRMYPNSRIMWQIREKGDSQ